MKQVGHSRERIGYSGTALATLAAALTLAGCAGGPGRAVAPARVTVPSAADSAGSETIRRLTAQYERGMNAGNVDTIVDAYYGDEYYVLNGPVARIDRRAWSDYLHTLVRQNWLEVRVVPDLIHVEGALGVVWGHYSTRFARRGAGGDTTTVYQRYVEVWRREADGRWKVWWGLNAPDPSAPR